MQHIQNETDRQAETQACQPMGRVLAVASACEEPECHLVAAAGSRRRGGASSGRIRGHERSHSGVHSSPCRVKGTVLSAHTQPGQVPSVGEEKWRAVNKEKRRHYRIYLSVKDEYCEP